MENTFVGLSIILYAIKARLMKLKVFDCTLSFVQFWPRFRRNLLNIKKLHWKETTVLFLKKCLNGDLFLASGIHEIYNQSSKPKFILKLQLYYWQVQFLICLKQILLTKYSLQSLYNFCLFTMTLHEPIPLTLTLTHTAIIDTN